MSRSERFKTVAGKLIAAAVAVLICISPAYASPKDTADQAENEMPKVSAKYYEAYDITSEQELLGSRENQKMYPASITKVLFAKTLLDRIREEDKTPSDTAGTVTSKDNEKAAAAGLYRYEKMTTPIYIIDPKDVAVRDGRLTHIKDVATKGMETFKNLINSK